MNKKKKVSIFLAKELYEEKYEASNAQQDNEKNNCNNND